MTETTTNNNKLEKMFMDVKAMAQRVLNKHIEGIVKCNKRDKNWVVVVEALERRAIPDSRDILGRYTFVLDEDMNLLGYEQTMIRCRSDLLKEEGEEEGR